MFNRKKNCCNNLINVDIDFARTLWKTYITKINQDATENPALENKTLQPDTGEQFFHEKFPAHLKFSVLSVYCQHTSWNFPTAKNGREYIEFLDKGFIKKYLSYADTAYWNYNLGDTVKKYVPRSATLEKRDHTKKEQIDFLQSRLLGEANIISDTYVAEDWSTIICDRKNKNQIAKYDGGNFSFLKLPKGKTVIVNSEAVMNSNHAVPQLYQNKKKSLPE